MKKRIKKWGDSLVIRFSKEETDLYGLVEGDVIEIGDMLIDEAVKRRIEKLK